MPYIPEIDRKKYDERIDSIGYTLNSLEDNDKISGELNYLLFRLASFLCDPKCGGTHNYARMAVIRSAMNEAQVEFHRRIMTPYEDEKIKINGDVQCKGPKIPYYHNCE